MGEIVVFVGTGPMGFTGLDDRIYYRGPGGELLRPGEFVVQPELPGIVVGALGGLLAATEGVGNENP